MGRDPRDSFALEPSCGKSVHSHTVSAWGGWGGGRIYIYIYGTPPAELSTNFGGEKRVGLHYAPDPLTRLYKSALSSIGLLNSIGLTDPPVGGGGRVYSAPDPLTCTRTTHYSVFAQSVSTIELSRVLKFNPED